MIYKEVNIVMQTRDALGKAKALGLDLVEVAPNVRPPVCRIVDYGKWKYEQKKQKKENTRNRTKEKEVKFRVRIESHDYEIKLRRAEDFLSGGNKLRLQLQFRGRENAFKQLGVELMHRVKEDLLGMATCDLEPKLSGRSVLMMMSPLPAEQQVRKWRLEEHGDEDLDLEAHEAAEAAEAEAEEKLDAAEESDAEQAEAEGNNEDATAEKQ
ncbi:MAG: translation initiation factor IF-3 [Verrucomicrobiales bacterium]|nr:translation initiation factor IF-3 [Verrucomicrobiales bacterium]